MLLHCKRDELRKLWIEGIEHKHVLNLLDEIENIKQVPQKLEQCMASKHYLNATDMLVRCATSYWARTHQKRTGQLSDHLQTDLLSVLLFAFFSPA